MGFERRNHPEIEHLVCLRQIPTCVIVNITIIFRLLIMGSEKNTKKKKHGIAMYRRVRHSRPSVFAITIIVGLLLTVISVDSKSLLEKEKALEERETQLTAELEAEQARTEELDEFEKYTKTKKYAEEMAKKKLGLVHENEIIFKTEDGK